jgi:predicted ArsR family transcriptional regulator
MEEENKWLQNYFCQLESGIGELEGEQQEELYRPCAVACAKEMVLPMQQQQFAECGHDLDEQYRRYGRSPYFFADIIEPHHVYEIGYPHCFCPAVTQGYCQSPTHCECSRQSILYVLRNLLPDREIEVQPMHTVLSGAEECRFRVTVEPAKK